MSPGRAPPALVTSAVTLALLAALAVAGAGGRAVAYQVKRTDDGVPVRWGEGPIAVLAAAAAVPEGVTPAAAGGAVVRSFGAWAEELPASISIAVEARAADAPLPVVDDDGRNVVAWIGQGWDEDFEPYALAITLTSYDSGTGRIEDADIVLNAAGHRWTADAGEGCEGAYDLENVLAHEVGHLRGLAHEREVAEATMFPSAAACEIKKRDLDADDVAGLAYLYEEVGPAPPGTACAAAGGRRRGAAAGGGAGALVAGALGLAALRTRGRRRGAVLAAAALVVALAVTAAPATATTVRRLDLEALAAAAPVVIEGVVLEAVPVRRRGRLYTEARVAVAACWKGACGEVVVVRRLGGEDASSRLDVEGAAVLRPGEEAVLFLGRRGDGSFAVLGLAQGAFRVERDGEGRVRHLVRDGRGLVTLRPGGVPAPGEVEAFPVERVRAAVLESLRRPAAE